MYKRLFSIKGDPARVTAQLRAEHKLGTSPLQHAVDRMTALVGMPGFGLVLIGLMGSWMIGNLLAGLIGAVPLDPPPFSGLQAATATGALVMTVLILTTQLRKDQLSVQREQLALELAILNDQKLSKIIALLEEWRRDDPRIVDRIDEEADAMSTPVDHQSVVEAINQN